MARKKIDIAHLDYSHLVLPHSIFSLLNNKKKAATNIKPTQNAKQNPEKQNDEY